MTLLFSLPFLNEENDASGGMILIPVHYCFYKIGRFCLKGFPLQALLAEVDQHKLICVFMEDLISDTVFWVFFFSLPCPAPRGRNSVSFSNSWITENKIENSGCVRKYIWETVCIRIKISSKIEDENAPGLRYNAVDRRQSETDLS